MKKRKQDLPETEVLHKIRLGAVREEQVRQGIFEGAFERKPCRQKRCINAVGLNV